MEKTMKILEENQLDLVSGGMIMPPLVGPAILRVIKELLNN